MKSKYLVLDRIIHQGQAFNRGDEIEIEESYAFCHAGRLKKQPPEEVVSFIPFSELPFSDPFEESEEEAVADA